MAYASLTDLKTYIKTSNIAVGTDDDDILQDCLDWAQNIIDAQTDRTFEAAADSTRYFDAVLDTVERDLYLDDDLATITSITVNSVALAASDYQTIPRNSTPYHTIRIKSDSSKSWLDYGDEPEDAIVIIGKWAYSTSAPLAIVQLTLRIASYLYRQRHYSSETDRPIITGGTTILPSEFPADVRAALEFWRNRHGRG